MASGFFCLRIIYTFRKQIYMRNYLGQFEEMVLLTVAILGEEGYGVSIKTELEQHIQKKASIEALHSALDRMERKGYLHSSMGGATSEHGGKAETLFYCYPSWKGNPI